MSDDVNQTGIFRPASPQWCTAWPRRQAPTRTNPRPAPSEPQPQRQGSEDSTIIDPRDVWADKVADRYTERLKWVRRTKRRSG